MSISDSIKDIRNQKSETIKAEAALRREVFARLNMLRSVILKVHGGYASSEDIPEGLRFLTYLDFNLTTIKVSTIGSVYICDIFSSEREAPIPPYLLLGEETQVRMRLRKALYEFKNDAGRRELEKTLQVARNRVDTLELELLETNQPDTSWMWDEGTE